jgi:hypothetical protein
VIDVIICAVNAVCMYVCVCVYVCVRTVASPLGKSALRGVVARIDVDVGDVPEKDV